MTLMDLKTSAGIPSTIKTRNKTPDKEVKQCHKTTTSLANKSNKTFNKITLNNNWDSINN